MPSRSDRSAIQEYIDQIMGMVGLGRQDRPMVGAGPDLAQFAALGGPEDQDPLAGLGAPDEIFGQNEIGGGGQRFSPQPQNEIGYGTGALGGAQRPGRPAPPGGGSAFAGGRAGQGSGRPPTTSPPPSTRPGSMRSGNAVSRDYYQAVPGLAMMDAMAERGMQAGGLANRLITSRYGGPEGAEFDQFMMGSSKDADMLAEADRLLGELTAPDTGPLLDRGQAFVQRLRDPNPLRREQLSKMGPGTVADMAEMASRYQGELPGISSARRSLMQRAMDDRVRQLRMSGQQLELTPDEWMQIIIDNMGLEDPGYRRG